MLLYLLAGFAVVILLLVVVVAMQPSTFRIERSLPISASPEKIFPHVNDFHQWNDWSPWAHLDPAQKSSYEGSPQGVGAIFRWDGNNKVGAGAMEITESRPSDLIGIRLDFLRPFRGTNFVEFTFTPDGDQTVVTWSMRGPQPFMGKAISLFFNCNKIIGDYYSRGLLQLKKIAESSVA